MPPIEPCGDSIAGASPIALQDCARHLQTHGLLRPTMAQALVDFIGTASLPLKLSITIGRVAENHYGSAPVGTALQQVHLLAATAVHAATRCHIVGPTALGPMSHEPPPSPLEWLYLAQAVVALEHRNLTFPIAQPLAQALARFYPHLTSPSPAIFATDGLLLSYATGDFLAIACGAAPQGAMGHAGRALGETVRLVQEAKDLFCAKKPGEIPTAPCLLHRMARDTGAGDGPLAMAWAHASLNPPDRTYLRHVLMHALRDMVPSRMDHLRAAFDAVPAAAALQSCLLEFERECRGDLDQALAAASFFALVPRQASHEHSRSELDQAISLATSTLSDDLTFREAWEVQRWGDWCQTPK